MPEVRTRDGRLTEEEILEVALRIVEAEGTDPLSMRHLAQELSVTPMAIYRYVGDKDDLLQRLATRVLGGVKRDHHERWQDMILANGLATWHVLSPYPGLAHYLLNRPMSPEALKQVDKYVEALTAAGFDPDTAEMAWEAYHTYVYGLVALESRFRGRRRSAEKRIRRVQFGLAVWVSGLETQLGSGTSAP
jgi:AcrR family transcriptional regulator